MSEIFLPPEDAFFKHPCAAVFLDSTYEARDSGFDGMTQQQVMQLSAEFGLGLGESAAMAFLAKCRTEELDEELETDLLNLSTGDDS